MFINNPHTINSIYTKFGMSNMQHNAPHQRPGRRSGPSACNCYVAIVHAIYQAHAPQESFLTFSMISGRASSDGDSRRWVTRTLSA